MTTQPTQIRQYAKQCLEDEAQALLELIPQLDENFDKAVNMIYNCKGKNNSRLQRQAGAYRHRQKRTYRSQDCRNAVVNGNSRILHQPIGCLPWRLGSDDLG